MPSKLEHVVNAIARLNGMLDPSSKAYQLRNPLLLFSFAMPGKHEVNSEGLRVFQSVLNGYKASMFDIELKASGKSRANAGPSSSLEHFLKCYGINSTAAADNVIAFLRRALSDENITRNTPMSYFMDDKVE